MTGFIISELLIEVMNFVLILSTDFGLTPRIVESSSTPNIKVPPSEFKNAQIVSKALLGKSFFAFLNSTC